MIQSKLGYPLFGAGLVSLVAGIHFNAYWPMVLGLFALAYGSLKFTDQWG